MEQYHHHRDQQQPTDHDDGQEDQADVVAAEAMRPDAQHEPRDAGGGVLDIIAQVDEQLKRIREAQQTQDAELTSLSERFRQLEESEHAIQRDRESLEADRAALEQQREEVEQLQIEVGRERESWEREQREREHRLSQQHESLCQRENELVRRQEELNSELENLRRREQQLQQQRDQVDREREELQQRVDEAEGRLAEAETRMEALSNELAVAQQQRDESNEQIAEQQRQLDLAGEKLREFAEALSQQNTQIDQAASVMLTVRQQERTIAELRAQLAETSTENEGADDRVDELTALLHERDEQIGSLQDTIERLRAELDELSEQHQRETADEAAKSEHAAALQALRDRVAELERELEEAKRQGAASGQDERAADELRAKARRIAQVATHVRRRHARLKRMRALLRERAANAGNGSTVDRAANAQAIHEQHETIMQQLQEAEQQREQVKHMRASLAAAERKMIRKWARPRAVTVMLGLLVLLIANVAAAWGLANHFVPAERTASITVEPRTTNGRDLEQADLERWQQWHEAVVYEDGFLKSLAQRLRERRLDEFGSAATLKTFFNEHLTVDAGPRGEVTYTLAGRDPAALTGVLDVLASTLVIESDRRMSARGDRAWAVAKNEREVGGRLRYAALNEWLLDDHRLFWTLPFLAGTLFVTVIILRLIYLRLIRAKQLFDEATSIVEDGEGGGAISSAV